jgi:SH3 domain
MHQSPQQTPALHAGQTATGSGKLTVQAQQLQQQKKLASGAAAVMVKPSSPTTKSKKELLEEKRRRKEERRKIRQAREAKKRAAVVAAATAGATAPAAITTANTATAMSPASAVGGANPPQQSPQPGSQFAIAQYDYNPAAGQTDHLTLKKGDRVQILKKVSKDWLFGKLHNATGLFPAPYMKIVKAVVEEPVVKQPTQMLSPTTELTAGDFLLSNG